MISPTRRVIAYALLAFNAGGHLSAIFKDVEYWPFSPYPMFRWIVEPQTKFSELWGVPKGQPSKEIEISEGYVPVLPGHRIQRQFIRYANRGDSKKLHAMVDDWMKLYEKNRREGKHDGPELQALRVYEIRYTLRPGAANNCKPDERKLILQIGTADRS